MRYILGEIERKATKMVIFQKKSIKIWIIVLFIAVTAFTFLFRLGHDAFLDYDEAEYAKISLQSVETNHYLTATLDGQLWFEKPMLQFWVGELFLKTGLPVEWALRLPSALAGIIAVLLVGAIVYEVCGSLYGSILGSIVLLTTGAFLVTAREFKLDVPVVMFIVFGLYAFIKGLKDPRWFLWIGIAGGLAVMTKSIVGLLLFPVVLVFAFTFQDFKWLKNKWFWFGILGGVLLALPWHLYEWYLFGNKFFYSYFIFNIFTRYQVNVISNSVTVWTYLKTFQDFAMPWVIIFIFSCIYVIVFWKSINNRTRSAIVGSMIVSLGFFLLFSISKTKVIYYLIPIYPWMAVAIGLCCVDLFQKIKTKWGKIVFVACVCLSIAWGGVQAIPEGYHQNNDFNIESQFANVEKKVGLFLATKPMQTVYFDSLLYTETIRFYGNKNIAVIDKNNIPLKPFYMVLFWVKAHNDPFYQKLLNGSEPVYQDQFMAVFIVR